MTTHSGACTLQAQVVTSVSMCYRSIIAIEWVCFTTEAMVRGNQDYQYIWTTELEKNSAVNIFTHNLLTFNFKCNSVCLLA